MCTPFPNAGHAGGKTFNYYITSLAENDNYDVTLISKIGDDEHNKIDGISSKIKCIFIEKPKGKINKLLAYGMSIPAKFNPYNRYGEVILTYYYNRYKQELLKLKKSGYAPDLIVLEWTQMMLFIDEVKKIFPDSKYMASEHDVTFLGCRRRFESETSKVKKCYRKIYYNTAYRRIKAAT